MQVEIKTIEPSKNIWPEAIFNQYYFRKHKKFIGKSFIGIGDVKEAFWWNRPLPEEDRDCIQIEKDGLASLNLPLLNNFPNWKSKYNVLINTYNAPTIVHLQFKNNLSHEEISKLREVTLSAIIKTLKEIGFNNKDITIINNDILLKGKKICGCERIFYKNIFEEDLCLTLKYKEEENIFNRLSFGKVPPKTKITGIFDEINYSYDKAQFLTLYKKNLEVAINEVLDSFANTNSLE